MASSKINVDDYVVVKELGYRPTSLYVVYRISENDLIMYYIYDRTKNTLHNKKIAFMVNQVEHASLDIYLEYLKAKQTSGG